MNYSSFPESVDTFVKKYPLQASDIQKSIEYKQLKEKLNRTPQEDDRLSQLSQELSYAFIDPEEWNKFQDALVNTQEFFLQEVYGYIQQKQNEFQAELDKFTHRDEYNPTVQYRKRNTVTLQGETYLCLQDTLGNAPNPSNNTPFWAKIAQRGAQGIQGVAGTGLRFRGAHNNSTQYVTDDAVQFGGQLFACLQNNLGQEPNPNQATQFWALAVARGQSTATTEFKNRVTINNTRTNVPIGIPEFNRNTDILTVIQNTTTLIQGVHYDINPNGSSIDNLQGQWNGTEESILMEFKVLKNFVVDITFSDGNMIQNDTVGIEKLKPEVRQEIDGVSNKIGLLQNLETVNKESLVGAVNENTQTVATHLVNYTQFKEETESTIGTATLQTQNKTLKGAINEAFLAGNSRKQELVDLLLSLDASLPISYSSTWEQLLTATGNISTGKKYATGVGISTINSAVYSRSSGTTLSKPSLIVSDLGFKPNYILARRESNQEEQIVYDARYMQNSRIVEIANRTGTPSVITFQETPSAYVSNGGFNLPARLSGVNYEWIAIE